MSSAATATGTVAATASRRRRGVVVRLRECVTCAPGGWRVIKHPQTRDWAPGFPPHSGQAERRRRPSRAYARHPSAEPEDGPPMSVRVRRVYDPPESDDGVR